MANRGIFKVTPVSTKGVGIVAKRPDARAIRGDAAMRRLARVGAAKTRRSVKAHSSV
ncbi:MAG TPA: hypothetical protein VK506_07500 [Conexibacter sp.]|nr:hypothetical protein [Conexibacter sp.]